jgi:concentrative nucleoside transporter, CNT family
MLGIPLILFIAWCVSLERKRVNWRLVGGGLVLQLVCAIAFFYFEKQTRVVLDPVAGFFVTVTKMADEGSKMVFGALVSDETLTKAFGQGSSFIFAFRVLPTIIFFSALTSVLYYLGVLQKIVFVMAWVMKRVMGLSGAESLAAAGEVFLGQTESALLIKPYVPKMTRSEVLTLMVGGMATIAGGVMAAYIGMLAAGNEESSREIARNLLCASLMNAPAAIVIAKILLPETEVPNKDLRVPKDKVGANFFDALAGGTSEGLHLALNIGAMLIAFIATVALVDFFLGAASGNTLSLSKILGYGFAPIAKIIGVESWADCQKAGELLGIKLALNEFVAYSKLGEIKASLAPKTVFLLQFALCGFANVASVGIQLGGISAICPEKRPMLASLGFRALLGGTLATLLSAAMAGLFYR